MEYGSIHEAAVHQKNGRIRRLHSHPLLRNRCATVLLAYMRQRSSSRAEIVWSSQVSAAVARRQLPSNS